MLAPALEAGTRAALQQAAAPGACVLALGDGPLAALAAARAGAPAVTSLQASPAGERAVLRAVRARGLSDRVSVAVRGWGDEGRARPAPVLVVEPHVRAAEAGLPWAHLALWCDRSTLVDAGLLAKDHVAFPAAARVVCTAARAPDLVRTHGRLGAVQGVDVDAVDAAHGPACDRLLARPVWQCGRCERVASVGVACVLDPGGGSGGQGSCRLRVTSGGAVDAIVLWVEYAGAGGQWFGAGPAGCFVDGSDGGGGDGGGGDGGGGNGVPQLANPTPGTQAILLLAQTMQAAVGDEVEVTLALQSPASGGAAAVAANLVRGAVRAASPPQDLRP